MLELTDIQKSYGTHAVLNIPSWRFDPGLYWLKGVNGSGKSTLMNVLAGLLPFKGEVKIDGFSLRRQPVEYRLLVNHSPAEPVYPAFVTGDELIRFTMGIRKGDEAQLSKIRSALGIGGYTAQPTGSYSSGMLKKLSLLLAFTGSASWILLDEPFTTLDAASQQALYNLIADLRESGVSFLITSHHDLVLPRLSFDKVLTVQDLNLVECKQ